MPDKVIDIFGVLRKKAGKARITQAHGGEIKARMTVVFSVPDLKIDVTESKIAATVARAVETQMRTNMLNGLSPSGLPMPAISAGTVERRRYREWQGARGGQTDHFKKQKKNDRAAVNFKRRFDAKVLGRFVPGVGVTRGLFGVESGMLAKSIKAVPEGQTWRVYFAGPRGNIDKWGTSAVNRVFKNVSIWSQTAMNQSIVQQGLKQALNERLLHQGRRALTEIRQVVGDIGQSLEAIRSML